MTRDGMTNRCAAQSTGVVRRWAPAAIVTLAATAALTALTAVPPAEAAPRQARPERTAEGVAPRDAGEPIMAIVSIESQKVTIYDADGWILRAPVSTGTTGRETPAGVFSVVEKDRDHRSNLYDDAHMPHMLRITWNGIALHGGPLPGYAASHGCVRMPFGFAEKLFDKVRIGTRVIISPADAEPVELSHPVLFSPKSAAIAAAPARAETLAREADEATRLAQQTKNAAAVAVKEAAALTAALRKLELARTRADAALAAAEKALAARQDRRGQGARRGQKQEGRCESRGAADAARRRQGQREVQARRCRGGPGRRQGGRDQEVRRRQGGKRRKAGARAGLGLHQPRDAEALRAAQHAQAGAGRGPDVRCDHRGSGHDPQSRHADRHACVYGRGAHRRGRPALDRGHDRGAGQDAKAALDRIALPQDVLDRIAPTASPRSSLIISDEPAHRETNYRTEFVVALSDQPHGGIINRPRSPDVRVGYGGGGWGGWGYLPGRGQYYDPRQYSRDYYQPQRRW